MQSIPLPEVLDPDRLLLDDRNDLSAEQHADRAAQLDHALHETCSYAQQLWHELDAVRGYLLASLPPDPRTVDPAAVGERSRSAAPTGPDDEPGWQNWMAAYAGATSVLAGPHLDSGFGADEARREARDRRLIPPATGGAEAPPDGAGRPEDGAGSGPASPTVAVAAAPEGTSQAARSNRLRLALRVAIIALAVRGLRRPAG